MKKIKKRVSKYSVEAYACNCGTPEHCIEECHGYFDVMQFGIQTSASLIQHEKQ